MVNMTPLEMKEWYSTLDSEMASIPVSVAVRNGKTSGKSEGKAALELKQKQVWDDNDAVTAKRIIRSLSLQTSLKRPLYGQDGKPTKYMIALKNRGFDPSKQIPISEAISLSDFERLIRDSFNSCFKYEYWITDIFPVEKQVAAERDGCYYIVNYTTNPDGTLSWSEFTEAEWLIVPMDIVSVVENTISDFTMSSPIEVLTIPSHSSEVEVREGKNVIQWDIVVIRSGPSHNGWIWTPEVLQQSVQEGVYENAPMLNRTDFDHIKESEPASQVGFISNARFDPSDNTVKAKANWYSEYYPHYLDKKFRESIKNGESNKVMPEFSITGNVSLSRENVRQPIKINKIRSVDPVSEASSGGIAISIQEARNFNQQKKEQKMPRTAAAAAKIINMIEANKNLDALKKAVEADTTIDIAEGDLIDIVIGQLEVMAPELFADDPTFKDELMKNEKLLGKLLIMYMKKEEKVEPEHTPEPPPVPVQEAKKDDGVIKYLMDNILSNSGISEKSSQRIRSSFAGRKDNITVAEVQEAVNFYKELESDFSKSNDGVRITKDNADNLKSAVIDFFFQNVNDNSIRKDIREARGLPITVERRGTIRSLKDLYRLLSNDTNLTFGMDIAEAMDTGLATTLLTYGMQHRMLYEFQMSTMYQSFRSICNIIPRFDFKKNETVTTGGFANFATVPKSNTYPTLTQSGSSVENYTLIKRGGIFGIALEDIRNDDVNLVTTTPRDLGRYAARMLSAYVWALVTANGNLSDGEALISDAHNNKLTAALSSTTLKQAIGKLQAQTYPNSTDVMSTRPANLILSIDPSQQETGYQLITPAYGLNNAVASWTQKQGMGIIVNPHTTDTDDFYVVGDPNEISLIELAFLDGMEEPQIQNAQTEGVGAWFTQHEAQWRIFHAYNGAWTGYRGIVGSLVP